MSSSFRKSCALVLSLSALLGSTRVNAAAAADAVEQPVTSATAATPAESSETHSSPFSSFNASFDMTAASRYLFQGLDYSDGRSVLQPNLVINRGPFAAVVWANYQPNLGDVNEVDVSLKVTQSMGRVSVSPGATYLRYPNRLGWYPSREVFADIAVSSPLNPTLSVHYDIHEGDGSYTTLGLSQSVGGPVTLGTNVYYQRHYYGMTGFPSVELKAGTTFGYGGFTLTPSLSRFETKDNGNFKGDDLRVPSGWLFSVGIVPKP